MRNIYTYLSREKKLAVPRSEAAQVREYVLWCKGNRYVISISVVASVHIAARLHGVAISDCWSEVPEV